MSGLSNFIHWYSREEIEWGSSSFPPALIGLAIGIVVPLIWGICGIWWVKSTKRAGEILAFWLLFDLFNFAIFLSVETSNEPLKSAAYFLLFHAPGLAIWIFLLRRLGRSFVGPAAASLDAQARATATAATVSAANQQATTSSARREAPAEASAGVSEREAALAARVAELEAVTASRTASPQGGNLIDQLWRYLTYFVPKPILAAGIIVFLGVHVLEGYTSAQKAQAETQLKQAEAAKLDAEAVANALTVNGRPLRAEAVLAELRKRQADAEKAKLAAEASNAKAGQGLDTLEDDIANQKLMLLELDALNEQLKSAAANAGSGYAQAMLNTLCSSSYAKSFGCR